MIRYPGTGLYRVGIELKDLDLVLAQAQKEAQWAKEQGSKGSFPNSVIYLRGWKAAFSELRKTLKEANTKWVKHKN